MAETPNLDLIQYGYLPQPFLPSPVSVPEPFLTTSSPLKLFDIAKNEERFLYTSAPMVRYSKACCLICTPVSDQQLLISQQLAFRQTVYAYNTDLCWTPMVLAKEFNRNHFARDSGSSTPLVEVLDLP